VTTPKQRGTPQARDAAQAAAAREVCERRRAAAAAARADALERRLRDVELGASGREGASRAAVLQVKGAALGAASAEWGGKAPDSRNECMRCNLRSRQGQAACANSQPRTLFSAFATQCKDLAGAILVLQICDLATGCSRKWLGSTQVGLRSSLNCCQPFVYKQRNDLLFRLLQATTDWPGSWRKYVTKTAGCRCDKCDEPAHGAVDG
jgi:hypothetical protein